MYPESSTKTSRRILIPEAGTEPPAGVTTSPVTVNVLDRIGPGGQVVSTIPAVEWITYASGVAFDTTTGLPIILGNIRTEPFVSITADARQFGIPSEHWDTRMIVTRITNLNRDVRSKLWSTFIHHANVGPHDADGSALTWQAGWREVEQDNDYPSGERVVPGEILAVAWQLEGWESKRQFIIETKFVWGGPA